MRISTRLLIAALVPTLVAAVAVVGVVFSYSPIVGLQRQEAAAIDVIIDLNALDDLARSFMLHHDERSRRQFYAMADETAGQVQRAQTQPGRYVGRLRAIDADLVLIRSLFGRIVENHATLSPETSASLHDEAEERLSAQLFIHSADAVTVAGVVAHGISTDIVRTEQRVSLAVTLFTIIAATLLTVVSLALRSNITRSLRALTGGTEAIGTGNLDHRIGLATRDELGELGRSFDRMAEHLKGLIVSRDDMEALALENAWLLQLEQTRRRRIEALHGVMEVVVSSLELREVARRMLEYLVEHHGFELANVWIAEGDHLELVAAINYPEEYAQRFSPMPLSAAYDAPKVFLSSQPIIVPDIEDANPAVRGAYASMGVQFGAYAIVPLRSRGRTIGTLIFGWRERHDMAPEDVDFYASLGSELGVALENARLYETERSIADRLQEALLSLPDQLPGISFAHAYHSASEAARVGGDFYDVFEIEHDVLGITIGDVAGKGLDAAVLTSLVKNAIRVHANEKGVTPARILARTNDVIYKATSIESFVTVFFGVLDTRDGRLVYSNAGHTTAALVSQDGGATRMSVTGPLLGAFEDVEFGQAETCLDPDDLLFLYTDGLTEARRGRELFGEERLFDLLRREKATLPAGAVSDVIDAVLEFTGGHLSDDLALLAIRRVEGEQRTPSQQKLEL